MKQTKLTLALCSALLMGGAATSFAQQTAYMCSDANIMFSAQAGSLNSPVYVWTITDGGSTDTLNSGAPGITFENSGATLKVSGDGSDLFANNSETEFKSVTVNVYIAENGEGCYSEDAGTYTVYILPKPQVTMSDVVNYCENDPTQATLTATTNVLTLPAGVTANEFAWTLDGSPIAGGTVSVVTADQQWKSELTYTSPNNTNAVAYAANVTYNLPGGASLIGSCTSDDATATVQSYPVPEAPTLNAATGF